jgi:hypothetical protein
MYGELMGEISVCVDCRQVEASGESDPERPADLPEPWGLIGFGYLATPGGEHAEGCPNGPDGPRDSDCDCEDYGYRTTSCEACGDYHHGDRFKYTLWRFSRAEASERVTRWVHLARQARADSDREETARCLNRAGEYRRYLLDVHAEQRRFAAWRASLAA